MVQTSAMSQISEIPIVQQALFLLREAGSANGIKITDTGALGRNFVQALWDRHLKKSDEDKVFRASKELECPEATRIHFLLSESKYVRKFKGKICLTEKGKRALETENYSVLYFDLFNAGAFRWNWAFADRYADEFEFIQQAVQPLIGRVLSEPSNAITPEQLYNDVLEEMLSKQTEEIKDEICRCLAVRFCYRFCIPFGVFKADEFDRFLDKRMNDPFEKTEFFVSDFTRIMADGPSDVETTSKPRKARPKSGSTFTPAAQKFWNKLNPKIRLRLANNAFCFSCKGETGIGNVTGEIKGGDLVLSGVCTKCSEPVARVIENDWLHQGR